MTPWLIIMWTTMAATGVGLIYLSTRLGKFDFMDKITGCNNKRKSIISVVLVFAVFGLIGWKINFINAIVCAIYFALIWAVCDFVAWLIVKIRRKLFRRYYAGIFAALIAVVALIAGWNNAHNVYQTEYLVTTAKKIKPLKIAMFADSHLGTTFNADGFAHHLQNIFSQNPDILIIAGDLVDDDTSKEEMVAAAAALGKYKPKYGTYFVFGNHDIGYYGAAYRGFSVQDLIDELKKNGVKVLRDQRVLLKHGVYIIGRRDYSDVREKRGTRQNMKELLKGVDRRGYIVVVDHQPADYADQKAAGVDLVLSGHTHGGQLFPFNYVGKWFGMVDKIYGAEIRGKTNFIVTSGLSDWAIKFKTGTKSEYVIINVKKR